MRTKPIAARPPVLLIHGIWKSGKVFRRMSHFLATRGFDVRTIDLSPSNGTVGLEKLGFQLKNHVDRMLPDGGKLDLVGFSMGGVVGRYYVQRLGGIDRVRRFITISTPHSGTMMAYLPRRVACVQMRPGSAFLRDLNSDVSMLNRIEFVSMWTPLDLMIMPAQSSRVPVGREVVIPAPMHALMIHDPRALRSVASVLGA